jgi:DNA-binding transcriptional MocR family regulator
MSVNVIKAVMGLHDLKGPTKSIALVLAEHAHEDGSETYPSIATIALESGFSRSTVERAIKKLRELQIITKTKNWTPRHSNRYRFTIDLDTSERQVSTDSVVSERRVRHVRVTGQSSQSDDLTPKEPSYNQLRLAKSSPVRIDRVSLSDIPSIELDPLEALKEARRIYARG